MSDKYAATQTATENPRDTEYRLFARVTNALLNNQDANTTGYIQAIDWNRRLWLTLQADLASEENKLPKELKAQLISLLIWVDKHSRKAMRGEETVAPLIEVNRAIMEGLRAKPGG
ncbi:MAG: flagellar biosynthesis regulator FlaF [Alphaproteobacteria bacterium]|nr:flagellar biosynthesis regulator FlaF [Alphaproteobacteria bacterium]